MFVDWAGIIVISSNAGNFQSCIPRNLLDAIPRGRIQIQRRAMRAFGLYLDAVVAPGFGFWEDLQQWHGWAAIIAATV